MKKFQVFCLCLILTVVLQSAAHAAKDDLPKYILDQLHGDITYTVINERNIDSIENLPAKPRAKHFLVIQAEPGSITDARAARIMEWVNAGGIIWFYDSRMAEKFGMKNSPLDKDDFSGQPHKDSYGTGKTDGINCVAYTVPLADHPVATGVQSIQIFLMKVSETRYSAVDSESPGVVPIFMVNLQKKAVVALKKSGKGWVIFKPLIWLDVLGGERFQANLMEFSGGYPVPKVGEAIIPPDALIIKKGGPVNLSRYDSLILSDGQQVIGQVQDKTVEFIGNDGVMTIPVGKIESIRILSTGTTVRFKDGREENGSIFSMSISFKTLAGKTVSVDKENILSIKFNVGKSQK